MKPHVFIFLFLCSVGYAQYEINFVEQPINPIPKAYLTEHFNLNGPIQYYYSGYTLYEFDSDGKLLKSSSSILEDVFTYDNNGFPKQFIGKTVGFDKPITYNFVVDDEGKILSYRSSTGSSGYTYVYDKKGRYIKKYDSKNQLWDAYEYDNKNRLIKKTMYFPSGNYSTTSNYTYENVDGSIKITTNYTSTKEGAAPKTYINYYKNGRSTGKSLSSSNSYDKYNNLIHFTNSDGTKNSSLGYVYFGGHKSGKDITYEINNNPLSNSGKNNASVSSPSTPSTPSSPSQPVAAQTPQTPTAKSGCVNGNCQNGFGKWVYDNGYYDGFWKNGKKEGYGLYLWNTKTKYQGQWENDQMTGIGEMTFPNQDNKMISGQFKNGQLNGKGIARVKDKDNDKWKWTYGIYSYGNLQTEHKFYNNSGVTEGCIVGDCQNKYGRYKWANGDTFTGFWENGKMKLGTYMFANKDYYIGEFNSNAQYHGFGRFFFADGSFYHGDWQNGKFNGRGYRYKKAEKKVQSGEFVNGDFTKDLWKL